jgi:hypothetical protein
VKSFCAHPEKISLFFSLATFCIEKINRLGNNTESVWILLILFKIFIHSKQTCLSGIGLFNGFDNKQFEISGVCNNI